MSLIYLPPLLHLLLLLLRTVTQTDADITGTNPPIGTCVCSTSLALVHDAACGITIGVSQPNECHAYTGVKFGCTQSSDQQFYEFFQLNYAAQGGWVKGNALRVETNSSFCGYPGDELKIIVIGDWGERLFQNQERVAQAMSVWADTNAPRWIQSTGDNIYPAGIHSWDDPQVDTKWRDIYTQPSISNLTWHMSLGNHDYGELNINEWFQVELSQHEPRWYQPYLWYDYIEHVGDHSVHFVIVDTEAYRQEINNHTVMEEWFNSTLSASTADWKIVVGHRNIFSSGDHGPVSGSTLKLLPIMEQYNVDVYICGHDHNLQHLRNITGEGLDFVVSGAGGALSYAYDPANEDFLLQNHGIGTLFFRSTYGFVTLTTRKTAMLFEYYDYDNEYLYSFVRHPRQ